MVFLDSGRTMGRESEILPKTFLHVAKNFSRSTCRLRVSQPGSRVHHASTPRVSHIECGKKNRGRNTPSPGDRSAIHGYLVPSPVCAGNSKIPFPSNVLTTGTSCDVHCSGSCGNSFWMGRGLLEEGKENDVRHPAAVAAKGSSRWGLQPSGFRNS